MFWKSITDGLSVLFTHWELWVGILLYELIFLAYFFIFGFIFLKNENRFGVNMAVSFIEMIAGPLLQGILVAFLVTSIMPILIGNHDSIPISFLRENWWDVTKTGLISIGLTFLLTLLPIIGKFISNTPGTTIFVQGAIIYHMLSNQMLHETLNSINSTANIFPGFWVSLGFLVFSIIIVFLFSIGIYALLSKFISEYTMEPYNFIIGNFIGIFPGILTLCIYSSYIKLSLIDVVVK